MNFSQLFLDLRVQFECSGNVADFLNAYQDQTGVWTIGIGTTMYPDGTRVQQGDTCTVDQANAYALAAATQLAAQITPTVPEGVTQAQFDAIGDFCYNLGFGAWQGSTLRKTITATPQDYATITANFEVWDKEHIDGQLQEADGLLRRRMCEAYLYQNGVNEATFCQDQFANKAGQ